MAGKHLIVSAKLWKWLGVIGLVGLSVLILIKWLMIKKNPQSVIKSELNRIGMNSQTIRYWTAVSAFETKAWTSQVYKDSNNLFALIIPNSRKLSYGEGQTIFMSITDGARALYPYVIRPLNYRLNYDSIDQLVYDMKSKGYFAGNVSSYVNGVHLYYDKFYG